MSVKNQNIWAAITAPFRQKFGLMRSSEVGTGTAQGFDISRPNGWFEYFDDNASPAVAQPVIGVDTTGATIFNNANGNVFKTSVTMNVPLTASFAAGLTAHSGGGQSSALALTKSMNQISTVAAPGDSVALPASTAGTLIHVINNGANSMQVFGTGSDTINSVTATVGVPQAPGQIVSYFCVAAGNWITSTEFQIATFIATALSSFQAAVTEATVPNYIGTESGANNAIAGALVDATGTNVPLVAGLNVVIKIAHTLQAGANTFALNGGSAKAIKSHLNPANNIATSYASGAVVSLTYDGTQWQDNAQ